MENTYSDRIRWAVRPLWYWRLLRLLLRSFWIAVAVGALGWQLSRALGWPLPMLAWGAVSYAVFLVLFPVSILWPIPPAVLARRLDRAFGLHDRLTTAHEIAEREPDNYLEARLLASAGGLLGKVRQDLERRIRFPWLDLMLAMLAVVVLCASYLGAAALDAPRITVPPAQPPALPALATEVPVSLPGAEVPTQAAPDAGSATQSEGQGQTGTDPAAAQAALDALARALAENAVTQSAGADLAQGNAGAAAERLRRLADAASSLDPETRQDLARSLSQAASEARSAAPEAADQMEQAARDLAQTEGSPEENAAAAAGALQRLAELAQALDQARNSGASSGDQGGTSAEPANGQGGGAGLGGSGESRSAGTTDRLQSEGQPVELPPDPNASDESGVLQPPEHPTGATDQRSTPYSQSGASGSGGAAADPLSYPWRLRNVIQRYFSPP